MQEAAMICPRPCLQQKRAAAAAALSQADQPICAIQPDMPPADRMYATDIRQTSNRQTSDSIIGGIINTQYTKKLKQKHRVGSITFKMYFNYKIHF